MQRPRRSGSAMRAPRNSAASTAVFLRNRHYVTSRPCVKWLTVRESMAPSNSFDRSCKGFNVFKSCWADAELPFYDSSLSAISSPFAATPKSHDLIFIYSVGTDASFQSIIRLN